MPKRLRTEPKGRFLRVKIKKIGTTRLDHVLITWSGDGEKDRHVADLGPHTTFNYALARRLVDSLRALEGVNPLHIPEIFERVGALIRCHEQVEAAPEGPLRGELEKLREAVGRCGAEWKPIPQGGEVAMVVVDVDGGSFHVHGEEGARRWVEERLMATIGEPNEIPEIPL